MNELDITIISNKYRLRNKQHVQFIDGFKKWFEDAFLRVPGARGKQADIKASEDLCNALNYLLNLSPEGFSLFKLEVSVSAADEDGKRKLILEFSTPER